MQTLQILIIDDKIESVALLLKYFQGMDMDVMVALDGRDGIRKAQDGHPDIILLDVFMPQLNGFDVCRLLKADPKTTGIPVLFLSANTTVRHKLEGFSVGGVDYIGKPFSSEEVLARVYVHLKKDRQNLPVEMPRKEGLDDTVFPERRREGLIILTALANMQAPGFKWDGLVSFARRTGSNEKRLTELFRNKFGMTVYEYLVSIKLEDARRKLRETKNKIQTISEEAGYRNASDFSRAFRQQYGLGPRQYRQGDPQNSANTNTEDDHEQDSTPS